MYLQFVIAMNIENIQTIVQRCLRSTASSLVTCPLMDNYFHLVIIFTVGVVKHNK